MQTPVRIAWGQHVNNMGTESGWPEDSMGTVWGWRRDNMGSMWGQQAHLEKGDRGAVAHAEQEEGDEDGDGGPQPVQLPILGLCTALVQKHPWTGRGRSVLVAVGGWLGTGGA